MNRRELALVIQAHNQTSGAFQAVGRDLHHIQRQMAQFSLVGVHLPRAVGSGLTGLAALVERTSGAIGRRIQGLNVHMSRLGAVFDGRGQTGLGSAFRGLSGILNTVGDGVTSLGQRGAQALGSLSSVFTNLGNSAARLGPILSVGTGLIVGAVDGASPIVDLLVSGFGTLGSLAGSVFGQVAGAITQLAAQIGSLLVGALHAATAAAFAFKAAAVGALLAIGRHGAAVNQALQSTRLAFETMTRSPQAAAGFMSELQQEAKRSAFSFLQLAQNGQQLLSFGFKLRELIPVLRDAGDAAFIRGTQGAQDRMNRLVNILGQIRTTGTMQGDESMQLAELGINARKLLKIPFGVDIGAMKIDAEEAIRKLLDGLRSQFGGLQGKLMDTGPGLVSTIGDSWDALTAQVTGGFYKSWEQTLRNVLRLFDHLAGSAGGQKVVSAFTGLFDTVGGMIQNASSQLPALVDGFAAFLESEQWQQWQQFAQQAFQTVLGAGQSITGWLQQHWPQIWGTASSTAVTAVRVVGGMFYGLVNVFRELWVSADTGQGFWATLLTMAKSVVGQMIGLIGTLSKALFTVLNPASLVADMAEKMPGGAGKALATALRAMAGLVTAPGKMMIDGITGGLQKAVDSLNVEDVLRVAKTAATLPTIAAMALPQGNVAGAAARGWQEWQAMVNGTLASVQKQGNIQLPGLQLPAVPQPGGGIPADYREPRDLDAERGKALAAVQKDLALRQSIAEHAASAVESARADAEAVQYQADAAAELEGSLRDHLQALQQVQAVQLQLVQAQPRFTQAWYEAMTAVNETHQAMTKLQKELDELPQKPLQLQAADLEAFVRMWEAAGEASKVLADATGDQELGLRGGLLALNQQVAGLNRLRETQLALVGVQKVGTEEWFKSVEGVSRTAQGIAKAHEAIRNLIFDTEILSARADEAGKLLALAREAGFGDRQVEAINRQQQSILIDLLGVERGRLATLREGTAEWHKQRSSIIDTISKITALKKQLLETNGGIENLRLGFPRTPFGVRGVGPELGFLPKDGSRLGREIQELLRHSLNPAPLDLDAEAEKAYRGGKPFGPPPAGSAASPAAGAPSVNIAPVTNNHWVINDPREIERIAVEVFRRDLAHALGQITSGRRNRTGE